MYAGNSTVVNTVMRWPLLAIPVAMVVVAKTAPEPPVAPPPPVPVVVAAPAAPVKAVPPVLPVETLCPPANKLTKAELAKLTPKERGLLTVKGCIKG